MRSSYLMTLFIFIISASYAQSTIQGKVVNKENRAVEFVTLILKQDSVTLFAAYTDSLGNYNFEQVPQGVYRMFISRLDYEKVTLIIHINRDTTINIQLPDNAKQLKEVVVAGKAQLIERKIDRMVFNVENSIGASGGDALDALRITPGVRVQDNQISMAGKGSVAVMIDDRVLQLSGEDLVNFLATLKSDNIKSIEVITNPAAKYDAEGNSGLINIKLKKAKVNSWNGAVLSSYTQTSYAAGNIGGNFNYQKDKLSFMFSVDYKRGARKRTETDELYYPDQSWNTDFVKKININYTTVNAGIDYRVGKKWTTGLLFSGSYSKPVIDEYDAGVISSNDHIDSLLNTVATTARKVNSSSLNWHADIDLAKSKLLLNFDYFKFNNNTNRDFSTTGYSTFLSTKNAGVQGMNNYTAKADMETPIRGIKMLYGAKISFTDTNNDLKYYNTTTGTPVLNPGQSNIFNYKENTTAVYLSGDKQFRKKWQIQAGLRLEHTHTTGNSVTYGKENTNDYTQLFPTLFVSYAPDDIHSWVIDYGRRISRPGYASLNPFKFYSSPYNYTEGNPFLTPRYTDNVELKYGYKNILYTAVYYAHASHGFGEVPFADEVTKVQYFTQLNFYSNNQMGFSESFSFNRLKWWESETKVDVYYSASKFIRTVNLKNTDSWGCYVSSNNSFILNKYLKGAINFWYQAPEYSLLYKYRSRANLDLALRYSLLKNSIQLSFVVQDILKTARNYSTVYTDGIRQVYYDYSDNRLLRISATYKFGNKKINIEKKSFGNDEEKERANN
ncbi:Outer membrane receptor proteins, mostly Fe transport [Chitinophaga rupis]|uniref:Outer membrane receptor proteins, mostly Fe transport n=1 Tax=Chitinophaga rupis TaxID=573321 RepID=A0A1H7ZT59_9BACT|nr:outer membrane beta-barrel family protein [Chitinophaga rupis]SEM61473.1 Outer membrane receptor proteins, mostly Fe transport [Chitinophaga rupis]